MEQKQDQGQPRAEADQSDNAPAKGNEKSPSKLKKLWDKAGLDQVTLILMLKGSLPPIIALAMYVKRKATEPGLENLALLPMF